MRIGVIGCGQFMSRQHLQTIHRNPALHLHRIVSRDPHKAARFAQKFGARHHSGRWQDVVEDTEVDLVVAGIIPSVHPEIARQSLLAGKPIYIEKPLADSISECAEIHQLSEETGIPLAVGFNRRFAPAVQMIREQLDSQSPPYTGFYRIADDDRVRPPAQSWKLSCRLQIEAVHIFDLLAFLFQSEPVTVFAQQNRPNDALVTMEFENGSLMTVHSSAWGSLAQPKESLELILTRGALQMFDFVELRRFGIDGVTDVSCFAGRAYDHCNNEHVEAYQQNGLSALYAYRQRYYEAFHTAGILEDSRQDHAWEKVRKLLGTPPLPQINYSMDKGWGTALEHFCESVERGTNPLNATANDALRATACALAALKSIQASRPVEIATHIEKL